MLNPEKETTWKEPQKALIKSDEFLISQIDKLIKELEDKKRKLLELKKNLTSRPNRI